MFSGGANQEESGGDQYDPSGSQPLAVFFDIEMGGVRQIYRSPEIPMEFTFTLDESPSVSFTLFDITGGKVEPQIFQARDPVTKIPGGTFRFGYLNGKQSQTWNFQLESYKPVFMGNAFAITVTGATLLTPMISTNQNSGTVKEILEKFCQNHKMKLNITPELGVAYMQDVGYADSGSTGLCEMTHHKWIDESDLSYIARILQWARDSEGKGGYRFFITNDDDGQNILNICRPQNMTPKYKYTVQAADSVVVSWEPDVSFSNIMGNTNDVHQNSYQRFTGDEQKVVLQQSITKKYQELFGKQESTQIKAVPDKPEANDIVYWDTASMPDSVTGSATRSRTGPSASPYAGINPFLNSHLVSWMDSWNARLTILGDPDVMPSLADGNMNLCEVNCFYPVNYQNDSFGAQQKHYTSGIYLIEQVTHIIREGSYLTILDLTRAAADTPEAPETDED